MNRISQTALMIALVAAVALSGCGGGGGNGNGDNPPVPPPPGILLTGDVQEPNPVPGTAIKVTFGGYTDIADPATGQFEIQLPAGTTLLDLFPGGDPVTPPATYTFSVERVWYPDQPGQMPPMPIFEVEYDQYPGEVFPPEQIRGPIQVWWRLTDDLGTVTVRF